MLVCESSGWLFLLKKDSVYTGFSHSVGEQLVPKCLNSVFIGSAALFFYSYLNTRKL